VKRIAGVLALAAVLGGGFLLLQATQPPWWERLRYPLSYASIVRGHARNYRLDPALLAAVIYTESKFHADARSSSGAVGLMQLLPSTAEGIAEHTGGTAFRVSDLTNPEINVRYGSWYLRHLIDKYGDVQTALAAYNAGQQNVDEWRAHGEPIQFPETRHYVSRVESLRSVYRKAYASQLGY
jgi:soluble lytic murein transglycosylase